MLEVIKSGGQQKSVARIRAKLVAEAGLKCLNLVAISSVIIILLLNIAVVYTEAEANHWFHHKLLLFVSCKHLRMTFLLLILYL